MSLISAYNDNSNLGNALEHWVLKEAGEKIYKGGFTRLQIVVGP
jgi:hypothetical protein